MLSHQIWSKKPGINAVLLGDEGCKIKKGISISQLIYILDLLTEIGMIHTEGGKITKDKRFSGNKQISKIG